MATIVLATSNQDRAAKLQSLINQFRPDLLFTPLPDDIIPPEENGGTETDNALLKANYYFGILHRDLLSTDSGIYFNNLSPKFQPGIKTHRFAKTGQTKFNSPAEFWQNFILEHNLTSGKIIRVFAFKTNVTNIKLFTIRIPFKIIVPSILNIKPNEENALNHFMVPDGFVNTFASLTNSERRKYNKIFFQQMVVEIFSDVL